MTDNKQQFRSCPPLASAPETSRVWLLASKDRQTSQHAVEVSGLTVRRERLRACVLCRRPWLRKRAAEMQRKPTSARPQARGSSAVNLRVHVPSLVRVRMDLRGCLAAEY